jgi:hypothetical protein
VAGYALDPDAIQSYIKIGQLQAAKRKWPAGVTMQLLTARPKSSGTVGLCSTDPFDLPKVGTRTTQHCLLLLLLVAWAACSIAHQRCWCAVCVRACVRACVRVHASSICVEHLRHPSCEHTAGHVVYQIWAQADRVTDEVAWHVSSARRHM